MNQKLTRPAADAALNQLVADWLKLCGIAGELKHNKISLVNLGRKIGITLQEISGHEQLGLSFYTLISKRLPESLTFDAAKRCVKLAVAMPEPAKTIDDANRAEQLLLEATGTSQPPKRLEPHNSREVAPVTFFFVSFADLREKIAKRIAGAAEWDEDTKRGVRAEVDKAERWIASVKAQLQ